MNAVGAARRRAEPSPAPPLRVIGNRPGASDPPDAELVTRALDGDAVAREALVRRHYGAVYAVSLAVLGHRADAEDNCHDALVRALSHLHSCAHPDRFSRWAASIARNLARNRLAHPAARRVDPLVGDVVAEAPSAESRVERHDLRDRLETALALLSPVQREVVLLHDLHDWPHDEIAALLGTSAGMSRQHLFKARRLLRDALGPDLMRETFHA